MFHFDLPRLDIGKKVPWADLLPHAGHLWHDNIVGWLGKNLLQLIKLFLVAVLDAPVIQLDFKLLPEIIVLNLGHLAVVPQVSDKKREGVCVSVDENGAIFVCSERVPP